MLGLIPHWWSTAERAMKIATRSGLTDYVLACGARALAEQLLTVQEITRAGSAHHRDAGRIGSYLEALTWRLDRPNERPLAPSERRRLVAQCIDAHDLVRAVHHATLDARLSPHELVRETLARLAAELPEPDGAA